MGTTADGSRYKKKDSLTEVFHRGSVAPTSKVLTTPSSDLKKQVTTLVRSIPMDKLLREVGVVAARCVAEELEAHALRPADFASLDLGSVLAARIANKVRKSDEFADSFRAHMRRRG